VIPVMIRGQLNSRIKDDPRISQSQCQALGKIGRTDPQAQMVGLDEHMRPVVQAWHDGPRNNRTYALLRNGGPVKAGKLEEVW
jgi:hypothetical protein